MPKVNREEYEVLKGLDDKWKWIINTGSSKEPNRIHAYVYEPTKVIDSIKKTSITYSIQPDEDTVTIIKIENVGLFQFIQWEDEEPHNIAELIEEYEGSQMTYFDRKLISEYEWLTKESEETEVKKDIEWLKEEVWKQDIVMDKGYIYTDDLMSIINEVDEPEVLSQEFIDEHAEHHEYIGYAGVPVEELQNLNVPKQELPVIPKFVAEFLIGKEEYMLYELFDDEWLYNEHDRVAKWLYDNDELTNKQREIDLVVARDRGYTVEEEQKYQVIIRGTEQEIKDYDERFWSFAVKIEELEEL